MDRGGSRTTIRTEGLELSEVAAHSRWTEQVSTRWQIPLLVVSLAGLAWGVWRFKPVPKPIPFETLYRHAADLRNAGLYPEASSYIETLLKEPGRAAEQARRLPTGCWPRSSSSLKKRTSFTARQTANGSSSIPIFRCPRRPHRRWARSGTRRFTRCGHGRLNGCTASADAVEEYRHAVANASGPHAWEMRKRMLEIRQATGHVSEKQLDAEWDAFAAAPEASEALKYWAIESKVTHFEESEQHAEAEQFLKEHAAALAHSDYQKGIDYLQGLIWYHVGRLDEAERLLRSLRDTLVPGHALFARTGWLLGRVLARQEAPEPALAMYDDVIASTVPGPYRTAAWLGRAEVLAQLERFQESAAGYSETLRLITNEPYDSIVDLRVVRESTTALYESLLAQRRLAESMSYLRVAARLVPPSDTRNQAVYAERVGDLAAALGKSRWPLRRRSPRRAIRGLRRSG